MNSSDSGLDRWSVFNLSKMAMITFQINVSYLLQIKPRSSIMIVSLVVMIGRLVPLTTIQDTCSACPV